MREIKLFPDGRRAEFDCQLLYRNRWLAVLRYVSDRPNQLEGISLPSGSITIGFYWRRRHYLLWRMSSPQGELLAHRFDICAGVRFGPDWVEWKDLFLDLWFPSGGQARFLDEAEAAANHDLLSLKERAIIDKTRAFLEKNHRRVIAEVEDLLEKLNSTDSWIASPLSGLF